MFICERRIPVRVPDPCGTPGPGNVGTCAPVVDRLALATGEPTAGVPLPTPTSVGRRAAIGGGVGREAGGGVSLMSTLLGSGSSVIGFGVLRSGGRACSRMSGGGSLATVRS